MTEFKNIPGYQEVKLVTDWSELIFTEIPNKEDALAQMRVERENAKAAKLGQLQIGLANPPPIDKPPDDGWDKLYAMDLPF